MGRLGNKAVQSSGEVVCEGCSVDHFDTIKKYHKDDKASLDFLVAHGVVFSTEEDSIPNCPNCNKKLTFDCNKKSSE